MRGSGSSGNTTTVQQSDPWAGQQPYLLGGYEQAKQLYESPYPQAFPASTVVPFANETEQAMQMGAGRATAGSPLLRAGQSEASKTLAGDYLQQGNPYTSGVVSRLDSAIRPQVQSMFAKAGGQGGSFNETDAYTRAMADATAPYLFQDYGAERDRMGRTAALSPTMAAADYADIGELERVGRAREELGGRQVEDLVNRHNIEQQTPQQKLQNYIAAIQGNVGRTETTTTPQFRNPAAGAISGGLGGASLALALQQLGVGGFGAGSPWTLPLIAGGGLLGAF